MKIYVTGPNVEHVARRTGCKTRYLPQHSIEKMELKTEGRKEAVNANEETRGKAKG